MFFFLLEHYYCCGCLKSYLKLYFYICLLNSCNASSLNIPHWLFSPSEQTLYVHFRTKELTHTLISLKNKCLRQSKGISWGWKPVALRSLVIIYCEIFLQHDTVKKVLLVYLNPIYAYFIYYYIYNHPLYVCIFIDYLEMWLSQWTRNMKKKR